MPKDNPKDNPWAGITTMGALDQKLYKQPEPPRAPSPTAPAPKPSPRHDAPSTQGKPDVTTSRRDDVDYRAWREIIENTETHNSSLRLTAAENFAVEDVITDLKRHLKVKTSLNELARLGLLYLIHDFKTHRENSLLYKVKKS
jgi:hypothetical protein